MWLVWLVLAVLATVLAGMLWLRRRLKTLGAELNDVGLGWGHVHVHPAEAGRQSYDVTLRDSTRPHAIENISIDLDEFARIGLETPEGFVRSEAREREIEDEAPDLRTRQWVPVSPLALEPGKPCRFTFVFNADATAPALVTIGLTIPMKIGGGRGSVNVRVPLRDGRAIAIANERANFRLKARQLNVMPNTLPGWAEMLEREKALEAETGND